MAGNVWLLACGLACLAHTGLQNAPISAEQEHLARVSPVAADPLPGMGQGQKRAIAR